MPAKKGKEVAGAKGKGKAGVAPREEGFLEKLSTNSMMNRWQARSHPEPHPGPISVHAERCHAKEAWTLRPEPWTLAEAMVRAGPRGPRVLRRP